MLGDSDKPQMPRRHLNSGMPTQHADHVEPNLGAGVPQHGLMPIRANLVENDTGEAHFGAPGTKTVEQRGKTGAVPTRVHHEEDGRTEQLGNMSGGPGPTVDATVEEPHHTLDNRDVRANRAVGEQGPDKRLANQDGVEVPAGPPSGKRVVSGIDVVGPNLEGRDRMPGVPQRSHKPGSDNGFAATGRGRRDDDPGYHAAPMDGIRRATTAGKAARDRQPKAPDRREQKRATTRSPSAPWPRRPSDA